MKRDIEQEPTSEMIQEVYDAVQDFWPTQFTKDTEILKLIEGEHEVRVPDTEAQGRIRRIEPERMETREGTRSVKQICALYPGPANIRVEWVGESAPHSNKTIENIGLAVNEVINQLNPPIDSPLKRERYWMVALGRAARLLVPGNAYWWDFPEFEAGQTVDEKWQKFSEWRRNQPLPLLWKDLRPSQTFSPTFGRMNDEVISWLDLSWYDLEEVFSDAELAELGGDRDTATKGFADQKRAFRLLLFSNVKWLGYAVKGHAEGMGTKLLRTYEHGMRRPAIRILPGMTSGTKEPGKYWQSVLEDVRTMIPQVDRRWSEAATASKFDSLPLFKGHFHSGSDASGMERFFEGDIIPLQQGDGEQKPEDINPLFHPEFGDKTLTLAQVGLARIERMTGAVPALEGSFGPSGETAWGRSFVHDTATAKFTELTDGIVASHLDAADSIMRAFAAFGETIPIPVHLGQGKAPPVIKLDPKDMENYRPALKAEYNLRVPVNKRADIDLMISVLERSIEKNLPVSPAYVMSELGDIEEPLKMYEEALVWRWLLSQPVSDLYQGQLIKDLKGDIAGDEGMAIEEFLKESEGWPEEVRRAVLREVLGVSGMPMGGAPAGGAPPADGGGAGSFFGGGGGISPETQGDIRAGQPFSAKPGGPKPPLLEV